MRADGPVTDLTEGQKKMAMVAGVPSDRTGLGAEYPKMVFKPGINLRHQLESKILKMGNGKPLSPDRLSEGHDMEIAYVDDADDEAQALADGWYLSADPEVQATEAEKRALEIAKDAEIAALRAEIAARDAAGSGGSERRGPGRPPRAREEAEA